MGRSAQRAHAHGFCQNVRIGIAQPQRSFFGGHGDREHRRIGPFEHAGLPPGPPPAAGGQLHGAADVLLEPAPDGRKRWGGQDMVPPFLFFSGLPVARSFMRTAKNEAALSPERKKAADASILHPAGCGKQRRVFRKLSTLSTALPTETGKMDGHAVENCGFCGKICGKPVEKPTAHAVAKTGRCRAFRANLRFFPNRCAT